MNRSEPIASVYDTMRMLLLLLAKPLGHFMNIPAALLGNLSTMSAHFFNYRINVHQNASYVMGSSISSSGEQIIGDTRCNRRFKTSI
ncbi:MAG TPA: hypothetical protein PKG54_10185 [Phycisphaerae bacterium]|jgi:hypothetical protein|nr:hypothetical protein [Phycisphaerae bacterium]HOB74884.1 hypothetical protein [Phycisphaerae bacterium]HOJ53746.1 hypothetical protein [Phycisphaerae bacterium]HPP22194.1 hypothetical protein [Phycisphaerae bacterium]HPU31658.1 hypothetical protein [Phycisphaerae bacterium]